MSDLKWFFGLSLAVVLLLGVPVYFIAQATLPPCQTMWTPEVTGTQTYHGHRIECFHGALVKIVR